MYFNDFPTIEYDCIGNGNFTTIQDITTRVMVRKWIRSKGAIFSKYDVSDGETPEQVAYTVYGTTEDHWIVLIFNEITNTYYGWPLSRHNFENFVENKYTNPQGTHHYEKAQASGNTRTMLKYSDAVAGSTAVTNLEYEQALQDQKKQIRLLKPSYVSQFKAEFVELIT